MKTGDIVLYSKCSCVCVGTVGLRYKYDRWRVIPMKQGEHQIIRREKFLLPIYKIKKYLTFIK